MPGVFDNFPCCLTLLLWVWQEARRGVAHLEAQMQHMTPGPRKDRMKVSGHRVRAHTDCLRFPYGRAICSSCRPRWLTKRPNCQASALNRRSRQRAARTRHTHTYTTTAPSTWKCGNHLVGLLTPRVACGTRHRWHLRPARGPAFLHLEAPRSLRCTSLLPRDQIRGTLRHSTTPQLGWAVPGASLTSPKG